MISLNKKNEIQNKPAGVSLSTNNTPFYSSVKNKPKVSIITPSNCIKYLQELEESIMNQTFTDYEWVIGLNNNIQMQYQTNCKKAKIFDVPFKTTSVGALKKWCCDNTIGEIIVEVDHDDVLTPTCLEEIVLAFNNPDIGFVYSDNAKLCMDDNPKAHGLPYGVEYGWTYKTFKWYPNKELISMNSQPLYPGRFGYIWYAPDHVRAWRRDVYYKVGGHDPACEILDDLDLMHKLYLETKFHYIPKCLYVYRIDGNNTWIQRSQEIQIKTREIYKRDITTLAERYCQLHNLLKIDLCGGINKPDGYISIDKENGDINADLENGIPLKSNSVGIVRAFDALEHIKNQQLIMKEIHRVLAPGGLLMSQTPSTDGRGAFQDPTHISFWNENSFWYWTNPIQMSYIKNTNCKFRACRLETVFLSAFNKEHNISHVCADLEPLK